jgi:ATP-dependent RNA helicase RhlB
MEGDAVSFACEIYAQSLPEIEAYIEQKIPVATVTAELMQAKPREKRAPMLDENGQPVESIADIFREARAEAEASGRGRTGSRSVRRWFEPRRPGRRQPRQQPWQQQRSARCQPRPAPRARRGCTAPAARAASRPCDAGRGGRGQWHPCTRASSPSSSPQGERAPREPRLDADGNPMPRRRRRGPRREGEPANVNIAARTAGAPAPGATAITGSAPVAPQTVSKESFLKRFARGVKSLVVPPKA